MKSGNLTQVLHNIKLYSDAPDAVPDVETCYRYLSNRQDQLDYKLAIERELPIGSGKIESSHRFVAQKRLKISGAWWKEDNADAMLALRTMRQNGGWAKYWEKQ